MIEFFQVPNSVPFAIALAVTAGLFLIEIISLLLGGTVLGLGSDGPDIDVDADFDLSADFDVDVDIDVDSPEIELDGLTSDTGGLFTWIGARDVPFLIWLVSFLTMFGLFGLIIQSTAVSLLGVPLFTLLAVAIAAPPALGVTRIIANWVAQIMPKTESTAMRMRFLGGHSGTITQGTAKRGSPAEVKIKDRHGNTHYLRVEPLEDDAVFPKGSDVTLIRKSGDKFFVI